MDKIMTRMLAKNLARQGKITFSESLQRVKSWLKEEDSQEFKVIRSIFDFGKEYAELRIAEEIEKVENDKQQKRKVEGTGEDPPSNKKE